MPQKQPKRISDTAVKKATGKPLSSWFRLLDKAGAKQMRHPDIARHLYKEHNIPGWWCQMVTVEYERVRGMRKLYEATNSFQIGVSKTLPIPLSRLYAQWNEPTLRRRWLPDSGDMVIRRATKNKSMRITWTDGATHVEVNFYAKGKTKSQVAVQHSKITSQGAAKKFQNMWRKHLTGLESQLAR